ncbi:BnaA05g27770D [Brassica napus]|uniref:(rape) hypothetical protein n=1 Tax=Brassica napus TaxID=3708 RepID=A0A078F597_BRANA|nr:unnamed protein product [Brassica napus]CDY08541.1 BnaA05g27770D [Brassica napus]
MNVLLDGGDSDLPVNVLSNKDNFGITSFCKVSLPDTQLPPITLLSSAISLKKNSFRIFPGHDWASSTRSVPNWILIGFWKKKKERMGRLFLVNLEGKSYSCRHCKTSIALCDDVVSKSFQSRHGKAYLFSKVANVYAGKKEDRMMMTGMHTVVDIYCVKCGSYVGWRYEFAFEKNQKYKEGKSVLERYKVCGPDGNNYWVAAQEVEAGDSDTDE